MASHGVRAALVVSVGLIACGGSDAPTPTSGPIESIVHIGPSGVSLLAVRHRLDLATLPIDPPLGLPLLGTIELDASVLIPLDGLQPAVRYTAGRAAVRCVGHCQLGDDRTPLALGGDGALAGDVAFSHLDLDGLDAQVEIKRGVARLTRWALASADVEVAVGLEVRLARRPEASALEGCVRYRPTAALAARDPRVHALAELTSPAAPDGWHHVRVTGAVGAPRLIATACEPAPGG